MLPGKPLKNMSSKRHDLVYILRKSCWTGENKKCNWYKHQRLTDLQGYSLHVNPRTTKQSQPRQYSQLCFTLPVLGVMRFYLNVYNLSASGVFLIFFFFACLTTLFLKDSVTLSLHCSLETLSKAEKQPLHFRFEVCISDLTLFYQLPKA